MRTLFFMLFVMSACLTLSPAESQGQTQCLSLYAEKGLQPQAATDAITCYEAYTDGESQNQLSYLLFFRSEHEMASSPAQATATLKKSFGLAEKNVLSFGPFLDYPTYSKLGPVEARILSRALYLQGVTLVRIAEKDGAFEIMKQWPKIQKIMKMILRLQNADVEFYGAQRTLAIANTRMPAAFGDKAVARTYFEGAIKGTDQGGGLSAFLANNLYYAELLEASNQNVEACGELTKVINVSDSQIAQMAPLHIFESYAARDLAKTQFNETCAAFLAQ